MCKLIKEARLYKYILDLLSDVKLKLHGNNTSRLSYIPKTQGLALESLRMYIVTAIFAEANFYFLFLGRFTLRISHLEILEHYFAEILYNDYRWNYSGFSLFYELKSDIGGFIG